MSNIDLEKKAVQAEPILMTDEELDDVTGGDSGMWAYYYHPDVLEVGGTKLDGFAIDGERIDGDGSGVTRRSLFLGKSAFEAWKKKQTGADFYLGAFIG